MAHFKRKKARINSGCTKVDRATKKNVLSQGLDRWTIGTPPSGFTTGLNRQLRRANKIATRLCEVYGDEIDIMHTPRKKNSCWNWW
jgi:hypothetical protein